MTAIRVIEGAAALYVRLRAERDATKAAMRASLGNPDV